MGPVAMTKNSPNTNSRKGTKQETTVFHPFLKSKA